jgi:hypothetical protein
VLLVGSPEIKLTPSASSRTFIEVLKERSKLCATTTMEQQRRTGTPNGVAAEVSGQREELEKRGSLRLLKSR